MLPYELLSFFENFNMPDDFSLSCRSSELTRFFIVLSVMLPLAIFKIVAMLSSAFGLKETSFISFVKFNISCSVISSCFFCIFAVVVCEVIVTHTAAKFKLLLFIQFFRKAVTVLPLSIYIVHRFFGK